MDLPLVVQEPVQAHEKITRQHFNQVLLWLLLIAVSISLALYIDSEILVLKGVSWGFLLVPCIAGLSIFLVACFKFATFYRSKSQLNAYQLIKVKLDRCRRESSPDVIQGVLSGASTAAKTNYLIVNLVDYYQPVLKERMMLLHEEQLQFALKQEERRKQSHKDMLQKALNNELSLLKSTCGPVIKEMAKNVPLTKARDQIESSLSFLTQRRQEMYDQWETAYDDFSWWNKLKYSDGPDFSEIDAAIEELTTLQETMETKHKDDFKNLERHFEQLRWQAISRMSEAKVKAEEFIHDGHYEDDFNASMLNKSLWLSAMSVPVSVWADVDSAMDVYDALRGVNGNFSGMSDTEIWWESLLMPAESLAGLSSLSKGAYFEQMVAADTGGQLHEHFNHPDTDIVVDGVAFQLKATGSESYIYSVDESIPVIATSEVSATTGVIDSGYSNEEITSTVDSALGGTIVDIGDTAADAILAGLGGLGFFATIQGINHASTKYKNGGDGVEALFEGAGVAIEGTARALVGAAEMGYNILASRPSRFIGRTLLKGLVKLDEKLFEEPSKK